MKAARSPVVADRLPLAAPGQRIALFGGSFNPPHAAHRHVSEVALARLRLYRVWWLVTPGNPLKDNRALAPLPRRLAAAAAVADDPRIVITGFEAAAGLRYTVDTVAHLRRRLPRVAFVLLIGADNLANFHRWRDWRRLAALCPIAVVDRPGRFALASPAAGMLARHRIPEREAFRLADTQPPAWCFLHARLLPHASSDLRARGHGL